MVKCSLIITVKDRLNHFLQTFPSAISQYGIDYELIYVNFHSNDNFEERFRGEVGFREPMFSPYLKKIKQVKLLEDLSFSPRKSKNMSVPYTDANSQFLAFSDVDVFISSNYLHYWVDKVIPNQTFSATRIQETKASAPSRLKPEINYGNFVVSKVDYVEVRGLDETVKHYGGDDDDIYHRLKIRGLREINPHTAVEARNYSIIHGDDLRLSGLEVSKRANSAQAFEKIYSNINYESPQSDFLDAYFLKDKVEHETIFEKE